MTTRILTGDCRAVLKQLPNDSVHCCVSSPPYWGLRSYLPPDHPLKHLEIGSEPFRGAHFATFPSSLAELCIKAGCPVGGTEMPSSSTWTPAAPTWPRSASRTPCLCWHRSNCERPHTQCVRRCCQSTWALACSFNSPSPHETIPACGITVISCATVSTRYPRPRVSF